MNKQIVTAGEITAETMGLLKTALGTGLQKTFNQSLGLVGINLEAPAKSLFPVLTPIRNEIPRMKAATGATQAIWRAITAINTANLWGSVGERAVSSSLTTALETRTADYKSIGFNDDVTFKARKMAIGFDDADARMVNNLLYALMVAEEKILLGGNVTNIGAPTGVPAGTISAIGGTLAAATYLVRVSSLTLQGVSSGAVGRVGGVDASGESIPGSASAGFVTGGATSSIALTWADNRRALGYNVYVSNDGGATYWFQATTTVNAFTLTSFVGVGVGVPNLSDRTGNVLDYDGIFPVAAFNATGDQYVSMDNGSLTSDGGTGIREFDTVLRALWNARRVGPNRIWVNASEFTTIVRMVTGSSPNAFRIVAEDGAATLIGGLSVQGYLNKYAPATGSGVTSNIIPIMIHPDLPQGTIIFETDKLPYPQNQIPNVWEVENVVDDYMMYEFAVTDRAKPVGMYIDATVLKAYYPAAHAVIKNVRAAV